MFEDRVFETMQLALGGNGPNGGAEASMPAIEVRDTGQEIVVAGP
jgi:hypothetical protein